MHQPANYLYLFDLDSTLISGYLERADKDFNAWDVLPGRKERLAQLLADGHSIGIITNQGGVAFGFVTEEQAAAKIAAAIAALGLPAETPVAVCYADVRSRDPRYNDAGAAARRKPSGAMIREVMAQLGRDPHEVLYIGDRPEDEQAAADADVVFMWSDHFFAEADHHIVLELDDREYARLLQVVALSDRYMVGRENPPSYEERVRASAYSCLFIGISERLMHAIRQSRNQSDAR